jgi:hypothetical protein
LLNLKRLVTSSQAIGKGFVPITQADVESQDKDLASMLVAYYLEENLVL